HGFEYRLGPSPSCDVPSETRGKPARGRPFGRAVAASGPAAYVGRRHGEGEEEAEGQGRVERQGQEGPQEEIAGAPRATFRGGGPATAPHRPDRRGEVYSSSG